MEWARLCCAMFCWACVHSQPVSPTLPVVPACTGSSKPVMVMYDHMKLGSGGSASRTFNDQTLAQCSEICSINKGPTDDGDVHCAGFEYNAGKKTCTTYGAFDPASFVHDQSTGFFQKTCVDSTQGCQSAFQFDATPQKILVGYAKQVVPAEGPSDCVKHCLEAYTSKGYECQSAMFYPRDQECILNLESRYKRPDLFVDERKDQVLYLDNNCAGAVCYSPFTTAYTKTADVSLGGVTGVTLTGKSVQACEWLCTHRIAQTSGEQYNCKSFVYSASDQSCTLFDDRLKPLGRATVAPTPGTDYYEKGCYASRDTCRSPPTFIRFPGMILVGYAGFVVENVPSVTQCLDLCLSPPPETSGTKFVCKSVMYYYTEQECILNTDTRQTRPDVFVPEGTGFKADYFDIACLESNEMCPSGTNASAIRIPDSRIEPNSNITLQETQAGAPEECRSQCYELSPEKCRSFDYNTGNGQCTMLLINSDSSFPVPSQGSDVYDLLCVPGATCPQAQSFDRIPLKANPSPPSKSMQGPIALPDCLAECLNEMCVGVNYNVFSGKCDLFSSLSRLRRQTTSTGSTSAPGTSPAVQRPTLVDNPSVDWYENVCSTAPAGVQTICTFDGMKVIVSASAPITGAVFGKMRYDTCRVEVKDARMAMLTLGFPVDPVLSCTDQQSCPGRYKRQCAGGLCTGGGLGPPALAGSKDCGVVDMKNGTFKATIVVQSNNLGIPGLVTSMDQIYDVSCDYSGVQAKKIQANATIHVEGPTPALIQPRGRIMVGSPVSMQLMGGGGFAALQAKLGDPLELRWDMMTLDDELDFFVRRCIAEAGSIAVPVGKPGGGRAGAGYPGAGAGAGSCPGGNCDLSGGIPSDIADPSGIPDCPLGDCRLLGGPPQGTLESQLQGQQLLLIDQGCPTQAVSSKLMRQGISRTGNRTKSAPLVAFRFDGSRSVRIICQLDICQGQCNPTTCIVDGQQQTSYGRRKRRRRVAPPEDDDNYETGEYMIPRKTHATASIVILDPADENVHQAAAANKQRASAQRAATAQDGRSWRNQPRRVCVHRSLFFGASLFLVCLASVQAIAVGIIIARLCSPKRID